MIHDTIEALRVPQLSARPEGNRREAPRLQVDEGLLRGIPLPTPHLEAIQEAQRELGRPWRENPIPVAQEQS